MSSQPFATLYGRTEKWPTPWTQSLVITLPKRGNLQLCQNYRTISIISHPSKVMLKVIQNRLKPQAEAIIAEEQAGFRAREKHMRTDFQSESTVREVRTPSTTPISCLHRFQESIWPSVACSTMDYHEELQHQSWSNMLNQRSIQQCHQCSFQQWIYWRMGFQASVGVKTRVPTIPHAVQHLSRTNYDRRIGWTCRHG